MSFKEMLKNFFSFVYERQLIWYKRFVLKEAPPWTDDPILQKYKFCNVYRELDKGTIYLIDKVLRPLGDCPDTLLNVVCYRFFNSYGFFDWIGGTLQSENFNFKDLEEKLDSLKLKGYSLFNNAYLITGVPFNHKYRPYEKHVQVLLILQWLNERLDSLYREIKSASRPEDVMETLKRIPHVDDFLAYEIWTDLSYARIHKWTDDDFVNIGPGAKVGIDYLLGIHKNNKITLSKEVYVSICKYLRNKQRHFFNEFQIPFEAVAYVGAYSNAPYLSLRNIEHALCEFRKYWNLKVLGRGRRRIFRTTV
jgi:hypothetical protein